MIVSFHPCFEGDRYILCAGRPPDSSDLRAIRSADAVILPQGCRRELWEMALGNCPHVFPDYAARFRFPGKTGQAALFRQTAVTHPFTSAYESVRDFLRHHQGMNTLPPEFSLPLVVKYNWGGEGHAVYKVDTIQQFGAVLAGAERHERSGRSGFLLQEYVPCGSRALRVAVIGRTFVSYWRVQEATGSFAVSLGEGARIDHDADPGLQEQGVRSARLFCKKTGINLAGFDYLFPTEGANRSPRLLEINYFFGRRGLGGTEAYYSLLTDEIQKWIDGLRPGIL